MEKKIDLFCFASSSLTNIWAGVGARRWAVREPSTSAGMKGHVTKSKRMTVGSFGLIYCGETHSFSTPFIVTSPPEEGVVENNIWAGSWVLPFSIYPLGNPSKQVSSDVAKEKWDVLDGVGIGGGLLQR